MYKLFLICIPLLACRNHKMPVNAASGPNHNFEYSNSANRTSHPDPSHKIIDQGYEIFDSLNVIQSSCFKEFSSSNSPIKNDGDSIEDFRAKTEKTALASGLSFYSALLISGIFSMLKIYLFSLSIACGVLAIAGVFLAIMALNRFKKIKGRKNHRKLAISVIVISTLLIISGIGSAIALTGLLH